MWSKGNVEDWLGSNGLEIEVWICFMLRNQKLNVTVSRAIDEDKEANS